MSALLPLFVCLILGVLVARFARPPAEIVQGINWWVLNVALAALVLELIPKGRQFHMNDVVAAAQGKGLRVGCFPVHEYWQDIGFPAQLEQARQDYDDLFPVPKRKP